MTEGTLLPEPLKATLKETKSLIAKFLGPGFEEAGEMVREQVRVFRLKRQFALLQRANDITTDAGFTPKAVNLKVMFPLLEAAVLEESSEMQERWASLLASAANPDNHTNLEASFVEILRQLVPSHAYLLDVFYEQIARDKLIPEQWTEHGYVLSDLKGFLQKEVPEFEIALENLLRLRLVAYPTAKLGIANGREVRVDVPSANILCATHLGHAFTFACGHGRTPRNISYGVPGNSIRNVFWTRGGSLSIIQSPPEKAVPAGIIPPDMKLGIEREVLDIAGKIGCLNPAVGLCGRTLRVDLGKKRLPQEALFPLVEFCAERHLQLETFQPLS